MGEEREHAANVFHFKSASFHLPILVCCKLLTFENSIMALTKNCFDYDRDDCD